MGNRKRIPVKKESQLSFSGDSIVWREQELNKLKSEEQATLETEHAAQIEKEEKEKELREKLEKERKELEDSVRYVPDWESIIMDALSSGNGDKFGFD